MTIELTGSIKGTADRHTEESLAETFKQGLLIAPYNFYEGALDAFEDAGVAFDSAPVFLFAHGSSGISDAVRNFGRWVASLGFIFFAPNSFALKDRITYTSPIARSDYERIHAMRTAELQNASIRLEEIPGFDGRYVVAGTSEGGVAAARFQAPAGRTECGRLIFSWSCEDNYHVEAHRTHVPDDVPVINVMSAADKFFSKANPWLDNPEALGHAGRTLAKHPKAEIVLIPGAPHTLFALPQAQDAVKGFLGRVMAG